MADDSTIAIGLSQLDALAIRAIENAAPVRFALAQSTVEREAVYRLRYKVIVERGWGRPEEYAGRSEQDHFDERAIQVVGLHDGALAASNRIVFPAAEQRLPTEETFQLAVEPVGCVTDWSRIIVARQYSCASHRVLAGLIGQSWLETRHRGYSLICGIFSPGMIRLYNRMAFRFQTLSPLRSHFNEERVAVRLDLEATIAALQERAPEGTLGRPRRQVRRLELPVQVFSEEENDQHILTLNRGS